MKRLVVINGTMGIGKSAVCQELKKRLPHSVCLDGDWCWDMSPFTVTEETKSMVVDNISHLLCNFLQCTAFDNVIFCWVMQEEAIWQEIQTRLPADVYSLQRFTLTADEQVLWERWERDVAAGLRTADGVEESVRRLPLYDQMETTKLDVSRRTPEEAARWICDRVSDTLHIRQERPEDFQEVEALTREAFWDVYRPGCVEHLVAHQLRQSDGFVPELDLVAVKNGEIVGNILYSRAVIEDDNGNTEVLCFGPLSVHPAHQRQGIGTALVRASLDKARELGYRAVVITGDPAYYYRFGFVAAQTYGITMEDGSAPDELMALELTGDALGGVSGRFLADTAFSVEPAALEAFDAAFPPREKHVLPTQLFAGVDPVVLDTPAAAGEAGPRTGREP